MAASSAGQRKRGGRGGGLYSDRESAMRHMRFQGHMRGRSSKKSGNANLDTGWGFKKAQVFDEKLGVRRNEGLGQNMFDNGDVHYIDANRMVEGLDDIKKTLSGVKKVPSATKVVDQWTDEEAFKDSGGVSGYIARAKNLMDTRKLYTEAIAYLDIAIKHALVNFHDDTETEETLLARELKATCLLNLAEYNEAEQQAEHILIWAPFNGKALYIYAESLYLQCKFERALMIFQRGNRLRSGHYTKDFQKGLLKTTEVILQAVNILEAYKDGPEPEKMIPDDSARRLIKKSFFEDDFTSGKKGRQANGKIFQLMIDAEKCPFPSIGSCSAGVVDDDENAVAAAPATTMKLRWKSTAKKATEAAATVGGIAGKKGRKRKKTRQKLLLQGPIAAFAASAEAKKSSEDAEEKGNRDLRRLKADERFFDSLCTIFSNTGSLDNDPDEVQDRYTQQKLEESGWDLSAPKPRRGTYDQRIANMASDCLNFIEGRKHFWTLQNKGVSLKSIPPSPIARSVDLF